MTGRSVENSKDGTPRPTATERTTRGRPHVLIKKAGIHTAWSRSKTLKAETLTAVALGRVEHPTSVLIRYNTSREPSRPGSITLVSCLDVPYYPTTRRPPSGLARASL